MEFVVDIKKLIERIEAPIRLTPDLLLQAVLSALRGCDIKVYDVTEELKHFTTARLRYIVTPHYCGDTNPIPLTPEQRMQRDELLKLAPQHFVEHWKEAVHAVGVLFSYDLNSESPI